MNALIIIYKDHYKVKYTNTFNEKMKEGNVYVYLSDSPYAYIPSSLTSYQYDALEKISKYQDMYIKNYSGRSPYLKRNLEKLKQRVIPYHDLIEDMTDKEEIKKEIEYQTKYFSYDYIYYKDDLDAAIVITKDKTYKVYKNYIEHANTFLKIIDSIYNDEDEIINRQINDNRSLLFTIEELHPQNIYIELCSEVPSLVQVPDKPNKYQLKELRKFLKENEKFASDYNNNIRRPITDRLGFYTELFNPTITKINGDIVDIKSIVR